MPGRPRSIPSYCSHKSSGQAYVTVPGRGEIYLGPYGSPESHAKYARVLAEHFPNGEESLSLPVLVGDAITINELVLRYWKEFVEVYHQKNGQATERQYDIKRALRFVQQLYGKELAREFGPRALHVVREQIIKDGQERSDGAGINRIYINDQVAMIKRMFKWGVSQELIPVEVHQALLTVEGLHKNRDARVTERKKVKPAPESHVDAVLAIAPPQIKAMIELQRLTGMRPDEVTIMRPCNIDRTDEIWLYTPSEHKMDYRDEDIEKIICLGPKAQAILTPWLDRHPTAYLFSPKEASDAALARRTKRANPKPRNRPKKGRPRLPKEHYTDASYCRAVRRLCENGGIPRWTPNQLRHNAGTNIRRKHGLEAARLILGHRSMATTEIYAEKELDEAIKIVKEMG